MADPEDNALSGTGGAFAAQLLNMFQALQNEVITHMRQEGVKVQTLQDSITRLEEKSDRFLNAFPDGDPDAHRLYHSLLISKLKFREAFWNKMFYELAKYGLLGFLLWAGYALWKAFLMGPK